MPFVFTLDSSSCSGCKACQVACKDKNALPVGVLWRRVVEVTGGGWQREGAAWTSTLFAYNLSLACNHCEHPKCAGVCPVDAYTVRPDGIVLLDTAKCVGCGYCAWACPYGAPQYDPAAGHMTKCNFCYDNIDAGLPPACVAACPLRALDYAEAGSGEPLPPGRVALWEAPAVSHPFPLPASRTGPHLSLKPHAGMSRPEPKRVANLEELRGAAAPWREAPLVAFTLLVQAAVGLMCGMLLLFPGSTLPLVPLLGMGALLGAGMLASFAHLGSRRNAWRVLAHLRKSWLSREILFTLLFGAAWLATTAGTLAGWDMRVFAWLAALTGIYLVHCMSRVYRLRSVPAWNTWRTEARFFLSAALLGFGLLVPLMPGPHAALPAWALFMVLLLPEEAAARWRFYQAPAGKTL